MLKKYTLPTGHLIVDDYEKGQLETLSIGDYGKHHNVKADFLGYTKELDGVANTECMPLSEKWVMTLSTQYGCPMKCTFCDVPNVTFKGNVSFTALLSQMMSARSAFPDVKYVERLNIHFARMGEPIFNEDVFILSEYIYKEKKNLEKFMQLSIETLHPVLTTSLPRRFKKLEQRLQRWCAMKNGLYNGQAGLQFSINSTCESQRRIMFGDQQLHLESFARIAERLPPPTSRKYCLNFAYANGYEVDGQKLRSLFDPDKFMCKITPIHNNNACRKNNIETVEGYDSYKSYKAPEESLKDAGFDVLVFIPSMDEEEGLVTCGNAITGGSKLRTEISHVKIQGQ